MVDASLFVDRRVDTGRVRDYLLAAAEGAIVPDHIVAEIGDILRGNAVGAP
jgi:ornithine cyclodeaminase/alanine dehydrogenase-like protein (mu-crystallin family)